MVGLTSTAMGDLAGISGDESFLQFESKNCGSTSHKCIAIALFAVYICTSKRLGLVNLKD